MNPATINQPATGLGSVAETNRLLGGNYFDTNTGSQIANVPTPINTTSATNLATTPTPLNTNYPKTSTSASGLVDSALSIRDSAVKSYQDELAQLEKTQVADGGKVSALFDKLGMQSSNLASEKQKAGVYDLKKSVDSISSQMDSRNLYYTRQIQDLQDKNPQGLFGGALSQKVDELTRMNAREQADLAIVLSAKTKQYDTANQIVTDKVNAETDNLKTQLQARQWFYEQNKSRMSDLEQKTWQSALLDDQRKYDDAKATAKGIAEIQLAAAKNGAPYSIVSSIGNSTDLNSAIVTAGSYLDTSPSGSTTTNPYGKVGSTTPGGNTQLFTTAQLSTGAAQAHMSVADFNDLNNDVKNFWIKNSTDAGKIYDAIATAVTSKDSQAIQDVRDSITSSTAPDSIKNYFLGLIDKQTGGAPASTTSSGGGLWGTIKSFFGSFF